MNHDILTKLQPPPDHPTNPWIQHSLSTAIHLNTTSHQTPSTILPNPFLFFESSLFLLLLLFSIFQLARFRKRDPIISLQDRFHLLMCASNFFHSLQLFSTPVTYSFESSIPRQFIFTLWPQCIDLTVFIKLNFIFAEETFKLQSASGFQTLLNHHRFLSFILNVSIYIFSIIFIFLGIFADTSREIALYQIIWTNFYMILSIGACMGSALYFYRAKTILLQRWLRSQVIIHRIFQIGKLNAIFLISFFLRIGLNVVSIYYTNEYNIEALSWLEVAYHIICIAPNIMMMYTFSYPPKIVTIHQPKT